ncbi:MAG: Gfo/Idh/MocA family oxidoreductase [Aeromicrobium erythreum]
MTVSWGVLATGKITHSFARDLALLPDHRLAAVGSRRAESAQAFAAEHGDDGTRAYGSYEELVQDPAVDVVYVATPHGRHVEDVLLCLDAGKAVLCEKALTLDGDSSQRLVDEARSRGLFLAEAMWMRTNPVVRRIAAMVREGALGEVAQLRAELGFRASRDIARLWRPELGASALLDIGIYPLTFANVVLGPPVTIAAAGELHPDGFDLGGGATLVHPNGAVSSLAWTQRAWSDNRASVSGDGGRIEVPSRFHEPREFTYAYGETLRTIAEPVTGRGYAHEIEEVGRCLAEGRTESDLLPLDETVAIMRQMDEIRAQIAASATTD